jgi:hypothetical protein
MSRKSSPEAVVEAIKTLYLREGRQVAFYTGHDTNPECAEDLARRLDMEYVWVHWDGKGAHSEPPIYVPVGVSLDGLAYLVTCMANVISSGDYKGAEPIFVDSDIISEDRCSNEDLTLICIGEEYEQYLDDEDAYTKLVDDDDYLEY